MKLSELLKTVVDNNAIDLFLIPHSPPMMREKNDIVPIVDTPLSALEIQQVADFMTTDEQKTEFEETLELNFAYQREGIGRFRVNIYKGHSGISMVCRIVKSDIPSIEDLVLPEVLKDLVMEERGLIFVVGATGSGKSSTLAAMLDYRNQNQTGHILTVEDPLEFIHEHRKSIVSQREVGIDTESYSNALKNVLRQSPDVISIGEIRDTDTMTSALHYAETGHLLLSTLHAVNSSQALERIINFYPNEFRDNILMELSVNLKAIISQRLLPKADGTGLIAAVGVLRDTPRIKDLVAKGEIDEISTELGKRNREGVLSIDQAIFNLYEQGFVTADVALHFADKPNNMEIKIRQLENTMRQREEASKIRQPRPGDRRPEYRVPLNER
ncbi:PilT/PilU family type 4a pilus ATPase [Candidatus Poribacteria bacterium]|nr:PilT/PilU family type 4a pilus ATPase [Candidatus Poribacteria bacterium]